MHLSRSKMPESVPFKQRNAYKLPLSLGLGKVILDILFKGRGRYRGVGNFRNRAFAELFELSVQMLALFFPLCPGCFIFGQRMAGGIVGYRQFTDAGADLLQDLQDLFRTLPEQFQELLFPHLSSLCVRSHRHSAGIGKRFTSILRFTRSLLFMFFVSGQKLRQAMFQRTAFLLGRLLRLNNITNGAAGFCIITFDAAEPCMHLPEDLQHPFGTVAEKSVKVFFPYDGEYGVVLQRDRRRRTRRMIQKTHLPEVLF